MNFMQKLASVLIWLFLFLLPTQFGKHIFMDFSYVNGVRIDYLALALYTTDVLFVLLVILYWKHLWKEIRRHRKVLGIIAGLTALNCAFAQHPLLAGCTALKFAEIYFVFVFFKTIHIPQKIILSALGLGTSLQLLLTIAQFKVHRSIEGLFYFVGERALNISTPGVAKASLFGVQILRPYGTFSHPNSLGGFYVLLFAWLLSVKTKTPTRTAIKIITLIFSAMLVFVSFSKVAIGALLCVLLVYALENRKKLFHCLFCWFVKIGVAVVVSGLFLSAQGDVFSLEKRLTLIRQAVEIFMREPFFGTHFGHQLFAHAEFATPYPYFFLQPVHNIFILFLMQAGLLLGGYVFWQMGVWFKTQWHSHKKTLIFPLLAVLITGMLDHYWVTLQQNLLLLGVVFGSLIHRPARLSRIRKKQ